MSDMLEPDQRIMAMEACMLLWINRGKKLAEHDKKLEKVRSKIRRRIARKTFTESKDGAKLWERYQRKYITVKARHTIIDMLQSQKNFLDEYEVIPVECRRLRANVQKDILADLRSALQKSIVRKNRLNPIVEKWREAITLLLKDFSSDYIIISAETQECMKDVQEALQKLLTVSYT